MAVIAHHEIIILLERIVANLLTSDGNFVILDHHVFIAVVTPDNISVKRNIDFG
ncbi:hypothetical protein D3C86_2217260 [compost metagenome]